MLVQGASGHAMLILFNFNKYWRDSPKENNQGHQRSSLETDLTVVNLSDCQLTTTETAVLARGEKFAVASKKIPVEDIIANVEAGVRRLPREQADEVRTEASRILARAKPPRWNIPVGELRALRTLRRDESIIILPAEKGSAMVVMNLSLIHI